MEPRDVPCPKCGGENVYVRYVPNVLGHDCGLWSASTFKCTTDPVLDPEHFHRTCRHCGYAWPTFDVLHG